MKDKRPEIMLAIAFIAIIICYGISLLIKPIYGLIVSLVFQITSYTIVILSYKSSFSFKYLTSLKSLVSKRESRIFQYEDFTVIQSGINSYHVKLNDSESHLVLIKGEPKLSSNMKTEFDDWVVADYYIQMFIKYQ